jgi:flagellar capping protein FliD
MLRGPTNPTGVNMSTPTSTVSGLVSGIDWETMIQQLMAIESRPQTLLQNRKSDNETKLNLWAQIQGKILSLQSAMEGMDQKSEFAVKSASSSDSSLVAVTASAAAAEGAHTVEVLQLARAHRLAAQGWSDKNATGVGDSGGDLVIQVGEDTITVADADLSSATTLEQLRNLINGSPDNTGLITASILDDGSSSHQYRLVLTSNSTGVNNQITITSNPTGLNFATTAIDNVETAVNWSGTSAVTSSGAYSGTLNKTFTFTVGGSGAQTVGGADITIGWVDSLGNSGSIVVPNGYSGGNIAVAEGVQLSFAAGDLVGGQSFNVDVFTPELSAAQDARVRIDGIYMNKPTNTVTDVLEGVTLDLLSAEPGTVVDVAISNDVAGVKEKVQSFVTAFNAAMSDIATFSQYDSQNNVAAPLLGDGFLTSIRSRLANAVAGSQTGLPSGTLYNGLSVIGVKASTNGLLVLDDSKLENALQNHFDDVVSLFTRTFSSDDGKIAFVGSSEMTRGGEYALQVNYDASGKLTSATINGQAATVDGMLIHGAKGTGVEGLVLSFTNPGSGPGTVNTTIRYSPGAAGLLWAEAMQINDPDSGAVHFATDAINNSNEALDRQIAMWDDRLKEIEDRYRRTFTNLETYISQLKSQSNYLSSVLG